MAVSKNTTKQRRTPKPKIEDRRSNSGGEQKAFDLLGLSDQLTNIKQLYECAMMAAGSALIAREQSSAIQSVMLVADAQLQTVITDIDDEHGRQYMAKRKAEKTSSLGGFNG